MHGTHRRRTSAWTGLMLGAGLLTMTTVSGCATAPSEGAATATLDRLAPLMTDHARALAGEDVAEMRSTGRRLIATYDAGRGR